MRYPKWISLTMTGFFVTIMTPLTSTGSATDFEATVGLRYYKPGESRDWKNGVGYETQFKTWLNEYVGIGLCFGLSTWNVNDEVRVVDARPYYYSETHLEGDIAMLPMGASLFARKAWDGLYVEAEAGARYVLVSSGVNIYAMERDSQGRVRRDSASIDMENGAIAVCAGRVAFDLNPHVGLFLGAGYQFDIKKGKTSIRGQEAGELLLKAFLAEAGIAIRF